MRGQLYVCKESPLYTRNDGSYGTPLIRPSLVYLGKDVFIDSVVSDLTTVRALTKDGQLYAWGNNNKGELMIAHTYKNA